MTATLRKLNKSQFGAMNNQDGVFRILLFRKQNFLMLKRFSFIAQNGQSLRNAGTSVFRRISISFASYA